jgi:hypothetical protein
MVACAHLRQPQPRLVHVRTRFPCLISSYWRGQPQAALPSHSCPLLPEACLCAGLQSVDVIVGALAGIRKAVRTRTQIDRRRQSQRAKHGRNDAAAAVDLLYGQIFAARAISPSKDTTIVNVINERPERFGLGDRAYCQYVAERKYKAYKAKLERGQTTINDVGRKFGLSKRPQWGSSSSRLAECGVELPHTSTRWQRVRTCCSNRVSFAALCTWRVAPSSVYNIRAREIPFPIDTDSPHTHTCCNVHSYCNIAIEIS